MLISNFFRLGQNKNNHTFFMAERMRKQKEGTGSTNRPMSIDEMNTTHTGIMLQSTNDSRIHEMLPTVSKQQKQMFN